MSSLSDIEYMISFRDKIPSFTVDLFYEWTRRVNPAHISRSESRKIRRSCTMSRDDDEASFWNFIQIRLKYDSFSLEHLHDKSIVNNLMIHIDRCRICRDNLHEHTDSTMNSCTVSSRIRSEDRKRMRQGWEINNKKLCVLIFFFKTFYSLPFTYFSSESF